MDYGDPSVFDVDSEIGIFDLEDAIIEYLAPTAANLMAIKSLSRSWRWGALTAFHWEGATFCKCGKHMLLNPTKLQKPKAEKDAWCGKWNNCRDFCTCNIPKCLKNDDELEEQIGGYPSFEFLGIDLAICHQNELEFELVEVLEERQPKINNVYFGSWPQEDVVAIRFNFGCDGGNQDINNTLLDRFGPRNLRLFVAARAPVASSALRKCRKLKWLDLLNARDYVNEETMEVVLTLRQLKRLSLEGCRKIPRESLELLRDNESIQNLALGRQVATDAIVEAVSHMPNLVSLNITASDQWSQGAITSLVTNGTRLENLNVGWNRNITQAAISAVTSISTLRTLDITPHGVRRGYSLKASDVEEIAEKLPRLEILKLSCEYVGETGIAALGKLTLLELLVVKNIAGDVTPHTMNGAFGNLVRLRVLDLAACRNLSGKHFRFLRNLGNLEALSLENCSSVDNEALSHVGSLRRLKKLNLDGCGCVTSDSIAHLSQLTEMESLDLGGTQIDDMALQHISGMTKMRWLTLKECKSITGERLRHLHSMKKLEYLDVWECSPNTSSGEVVTRCGEMMNMLKYLCVTEMGSSSEQLVDREMRTRFYLTVVRVVSF